MKNEFDWSKLSDEERAWALLLLLFATSDQKIIQEKKKMRKRRNQMSKAAQERYDRENTVKITIKLNKKTDAEIIELLSSAPSKQGLIKKILKNFCKNS